MLGSPGSLTQKLLLQNETIFIWFLECSWFAVIHFAYCCIVCSTLLHWRNIYHCKTHVCLVSACHVFEIPGSVFDSPKTWAYPYHDKRNGMWINVLYTERNLYMILNAKYSRWTTCIVILLSFSLKGSLFILKIKLKDLLFNIKLKDLLGFLSIAVFLVLGVGIYYHANLWPDHQSIWSGDWTNWRIWTIIYYPYWQLYGELNLDYLDGKWNEHMIYKSD